MTQKQAEDFADSILPNVPKLLSVVGFVPDVFIDPVDPNVEGSFCFIIYKSFEASKESREYSEEERPTNNKTIQKCEFADMPDFYIARTRDSKKIEQALKYIEAASNGELKFIQREKTIISNRD